MPLDRLLRRLPALVAITLLAVGLLFGCGSEDAPVFDNPFDPTNPASHDPFGLQAVYIGGQVELTWTVPVGVAIDSLIVQSIYNDQPADLAVLAPDAVTYLDDDPAGNSLNQYQLRARDNVGRLSLSSGIVTADVFVPPIIVLASGETAIRTAVQDVTVLAELGDVVQIDTVGDFSTTDYHLIVDGQYDTTFLCLANHYPVPSCTLFARAGIVLEGVELPMWSSLYDTLALSFNFTPSISKFGGGNTVATPFVDVVLGFGGMGVESVRFATSIADLATAAWLTGDPAVVPDVPLRDFPGEQTLYAEFLSDFGFLVPGESGGDPESMTLYGDDLTTVTVAPDTLEGGLVEDRVLVVLSDAVATQMRLSENPGFPGAEWFAYADTTEFELTGDPGPQTVYAQFRNHWFVSSISSVSFVLSGAMIDLEIATPADTSAVRGGSTVTVSGQAQIVDTDFLLTSLDVHLGEGWQPIDPDPAWSTEWDVPLLAADTPWPIGVRATATNGADETITGVAWTEVTISQLTLAITRPEAGVEVTSGAAVSIRGLATADLTASPLDSVVVAAGDTVMTTLDDLTGWSVSWSPAAVTEPETVEITAWAYAREDTTADAAVTSVSQVVEVVLVPPVVEE